MLIGTRVFNPVDVDCWDVDLLQITCYNGMTGNIQRLEECSSMCRNVGIPYVIHPVGYYILDKESYEALKIIAGYADLSLILHDEKNREGKRLEGQDESFFRAALYKLGSLTPISFENATDTGDVCWFWDRYAESITLDIGHIEAGGYNSIDYVRNLNDNTIKKIQYVHLHRNNGWHSGLTDHWPISSNCRELRALRELLLMKPDVSVILEINDTTMITHSIELLKELREELNL